MTSELYSVARTLAPAKVNLALFVGSRRADGFHDLATIFQAISLADEVCVVLGDAGAGPDEHGPVRLVMEGPELGPVEENLAWRAAAAFMREVRIDAPISVFLRKEIPAGAGLGGGSSDAAAVLRCLSALAGGSPPGLLEAIAASLGSDVPFFLGPSGTAIGEGRGERIEAVDALPEQLIAVALPPVHVATGPAYRALTSSRTGGTVAPLPALDRRFSWAELVGGRMANDFEEVVSAQFVPVEESLSAMREAGAAVAMLSGSGAASFALFGPWTDTEGFARWCAGVSTTLGWPVVPCTTLGLIPPVNLS